MPRSNILARLLVLLSVGAFVAACGGQANLPPTAVAVPPTVVQQPTASPAPTEKPTATPAPTKTAVPTPTPNPIADPITGAPALTRGQVKQRPYMVMIDNHPDAYPQSGLDKAAVVFEALAEYGVTRFIALYAPGITPDVDEIGPVRSTRVYFAQWAMGFHAVYAHAGGSPGGLELVESTDELINLDGLRADGSKYFHRVKTRYAPHNLYTSTDDLAQAAEDFGGDELDGAEIGFLFKTDAPAAQRPSSGEFSYFFIYEEDPAGWTYDPETNGYLRLRRGRPAIDSVTGEQLWTKNVVVMEVEEQRIAGDDKGRIEQAVIGSGSARLFADGVEREITWRKESAADALRFYASGSEEVRLNTGPVWIVAIPSLENLTVEG